MIVNGKEIEFKEEITIDELIAKYELSKKYLVVEVDGEIIPRENYSMKLKSDSVVELVSFVGGG